MNGVSVPQRALVTVGVTLAACAVAFGLGVSSASRPVLALAALGVGATGAVAVAIWRRPLAALGVLVVLLPLHQLVLAKLYVSGVPASILELAKFWKELVVVVLLARVLHDGWGEMDSLDWLAFAFLGLVALYFAAPVGLALNTKLLAAREDGVMVLVFLVARRLRLPRQAVPRLEGLLLGVGVLLALGAIWNHVAPDSWSNWVDSTGFHRYQREVLGIRQSLELNVVYDSFAGQAFIRSGSLFVSPLTLGIYCLIPTGIAIGRVAGSDRSGWTVFAGLMAVLAVLLSLTRSAIIALPVMALAVGMLARAKERVAVVILVAALALYPIASAVGFGSRIVSAFDQQSNSTAAHTGALQQSVIAVVDRPLGTGLGTGGVQGERTSAGGYTDNESWYFQIGTELGLLGMVVYICFQVAVLRGLWRRSRDNIAGAAGAFAGLLGVAIAGIFLFSFTDLSVSWCVFLLAGLALPCQPHVAVDDFSKAVVRRLPAR